MIDFKKASGFYYVYHDDKLLGGVRKVEDWTVRGNRVRWEAFAKGRMLGSASTRNDAAEILRA